MVREWDFLYTEAMANTHKDGKKDVRVGCSGWSYRDWREGLYEGVPQRRWLERYAEEFDTVEVNATFYRLPREKTVADWVDQTPPGFSFAVVLTALRASLDLTDMPLSYPRGGRR